MRWPDDLEIAPVEGEDARYFISLSDRHDGCIHKIEACIRIVLKNVRCSKQILFFKGDWPELGI
jgi:hypothetical protein